MKIALWTAAGLITIICLYFVIALGLIFFPTKPYFKDSEMTAEQYRIFEESIGVNFSQETPYRSQIFTARDGTKLSARRYGPKEARDAFILVHGIASPGERWNRPAGLLSKSTGAEVIAFDLRGHGASEGKRYDLDYIGQYEDDIADIASTMLKERADRRIFLAGHSMGGGITLRYPLKADAPAIEGYLLFAPNFGSGPTQRPIDPNAEVKPIMAFNNTRLIGLIMLNITGVKALNHLPVIFLNAPPEMPAYSYKAAATAQPSPPQSVPIALQSIKKPLLLIVGAEDEAFVAEAYEGLVSANSDGETIVLPDHNHNSLLNDEDTYTHVKRWFEAIEK